MTPGGAAPSARVLADRALWSRAPSAHNTQPWRVEALDDERLALGWHPDRTLPVGDPDRRDLLLSLGALTESLTVCAAARGIGTRVTWEIDPARAHAATLTLTAHERAGAVISPDALTPTDLARRCTARGPFTEPFCADAQVSGLGAAARLPRDAAVQPVPADLIAECLRVADRWTFEGPAAAELASWLRLRDAGAPDGLTAAALGLPAWQARGLALALHPRVLPVLRRTGLTRVLAASATSRPLGTVVALTAPKDLADGAVAALGGPLLRTWLHAGRAGWSTHPVSQVIDCPESAAWLHAWAGPGLACYAVFRVGTAQVKPPPSARLTDALTPAGTPPPARPGTPSRHR